MINLHNSAGSKQVTPEWFLSQFSSVRHTGGDRWMACCSAHDDRHPSLSIRFESDRILIHCFAGCSTTDVLEAVGLTLADLFLDDSAKQYTGKSRSSYSSVRELESLMWQLELRGDAIRERAETFLPVTHDIDTSDWTDAERDRVLTMVSLAREDVKKAERINEVVHRFNQWRRRHKNSTHTSPEAA